MVAHGRYRVPAINTLVAFETAARLGNFSRAAVELKTSQPAISRQIARLEAFLSTRLFQRNRAGAVFTDAGRRFQEGVVHGLGILQANSG